MENKIPLYRELFEYTCHDCGTNTGVFSVKLNEIIDYDLCQDCLESRIKETSED